MSIITFALTTLEVVILYLVIFRFMPGAPEPLNWLKILLLVVVILLYTFWALRVLGFLSAGAGLTVGG